MLDINETTVSSVLLNDGWHQPIATKEITFAFGRVASCRWAELTRATVS